MCKRQQINNISSLGQLTRLETLKLAGTGLDATNTSTVAILQAMPHLDLLTLCPTVDTAGWSGQEGLDEFNALYAPLAHIEFGVSDTNAFQVGSGSCCDTARWVNVAGTETNPPSFSTIRTDPDGTGHGFTHPNRPPSVGGVAVGDKIYMSPQGLDDVPVLDTTTGRITMIDTGSSTPTFSTIPITCL